MFTVGWVISISDHLSYRIGAGLYLVHFDFVGLSLSLRYYSLDLFNKIASSCFQKCTSAKHREPDLSLGEMTCTDRCVSKYLEAQERVGAVLQKANEAQMAQQQNMVDMQQRMASGNAK
jgi:mitochondrial import inner membrane translocase subunit TIM10